METQEKCCRNVHCKSIWKCVGFGVLGVIGFIAFAGIIGLAISWLWNCLMPSLFNLPIIGFWQAIGLAVLARLLIGASHGGWHRKFGRKWKHAHGHFSCNYGNNCKCGGNCQCGSHSQSKNANDLGWGCNSDSNSKKWSYYDKFWEEEGEKNFNDYIARKENNQSNS